MNFIQRTFFICFLIVSLGFSSCKYIPFLSKKTDERQVTEASLAYFVPDQKTELLAKKTIKVNGDLNEIVNIISGLLQSHTGAPTSVVRNSSPEPGVGGKREIMKVVTADIAVDSLPKFKEQFLLGYYLLEDTSFVISPTKMQYKIESQISIRGQDFFVDFSLTGKTNWVVYERKKNGELKKLPESYKPKIGVGTYRAKKEVIKTSRIGNELKEYEYYTVNVKDQPISKGTTEDFLYNLVMDKFAINNIIAQTYMQ